MTVKADWVDKDTPGHSAADWTFDAAAANSVATQVNTNTSNIAAKYTKPGGGIPSSDMTAAVQASLANADAAAAQIFDVRSYNATGDGTTDDTAAFNAAIDAAHDAAVAIAADNMVMVVAVPPGHYRLTNLTVPEFVLLDCRGARFTPTAGMTGALISLTGQHGGIQGAYLHGNNNAGASGISVASDGFRKVISHCRLQHWQGRAILDDGVCTEIRFIWAVGLAGADSLSVYTGVVELTGADGYISDCEINASRNVAGEASASFKACGLVVNGPNYMVVDTINECCDIGVYIGPDSTLNSFLGVRAELCYGHGWLINSGDGRITGCSATRNGLETDNTYDGFHFVDASSTWSQYTVTGCVSNCNAPDANKQRYGFFDDNTPTLNRYANNISMFDRAAVGGTAALDNVVMTIKDAVGVTAARFDSVASAVNWPVFGNSAQYYPVGLTAEGADTNITFTVIPKGTGKLQIWSNSNVPALLGSGPNGNNNLDLQTVGTGVVTANSNPVGVKVAVPSTATSTGVVGQWAADSSFLYVCTAADTWRRVAIAAW